MYSLQFGLALAAVTAVSGYPLTLGDSNYLDCNRFFSEDAGQPASDTEE